MSRIDCGEDDYDFDYLLGTSKDAYNRSRTFTLDEYGNPIRPRRRARIPQDNVVKLPPVLVGQTRNQTRPGVDITAMAKDRRVRQTTATVREPDWGEALQRERDKLKAKRQLQKENSTGQSYRPYHERKPVGAVQTGTAPAHDRQLIDYRIPPTVDRHRIAHHIDQEPCRPSFANKGLSQTRTANSAYTPDHHQNTNGDRLTAHKDNRKHDEGLRYYAPAPPAVPNYSQSNCTGGHVPAPPSCKPSDNHSYNKTRRQLRYHNQELETNIPIYKPEESQKATTCVRKAPSKVSEFEHDLDKDIKEALEMENEFAALNDEVKLLISQCDRLDKLDNDVTIYKPQRAFNNKPVPCVSEFEDDLGQEIKEAVEVETKFAALNDKVTSLKNECNGFATGAEKRLTTDDVDNFLDELDDILANPTSARPNSVAAANRNLDGCTTPLRMSSAAVVPHMSKEPLKQWNGQTAKRGVGFKSKLKKIEPKVKHAGDDIIPDRVRQRMNKYLN